MSEKSKESEPSLFIAVFDTVSGAETVHDVLLNMQNAEMAHIKSASIVLRNKRGKLKVHHRFGLNRWTGAAGGVAIGFLLGGPLLGGAIGALVGSRGKGEERPAKAFLDDKLGQDQSALIVVFEDADWEAVDAMFTRYNAEILKMELSAEAEQALTDAAADNTVAQAVHAEVDIEATE
ncbi:MAG: DUF1269 domain-containing protein [Anaerolineae bacterium]|nr:DUF1269 domain-containing protein [Anaerolineae bacterium]MCO5206499.1 DUF1269 domain-containing protein [Anaerolineae bacterium]